MWSFNFFYFASYLFGKTAASICPGINYRGTNKQLVVRFELRFIFHVIWNRVGSVKFWDRLKMYQKQKEIRNCLCYFFVFVKKKSMRWNYKTTTFRKYVHHADPLKIIISLITNLWHIPELIYFCFRRNIFITSFSFFSSFFSFFKSLSDHHLHSKP